MGVDELCLIYSADVVARDLVSAFPFVVFTSGRRNLLEQAQAMAANLMHNKRWIEQTYAPSPVRDACQEWVTNATEGASISAGLLSVLRGFDDHQIARLSKHPAGLAFDVHPVPDPQGAAVKAWLYAKAAEVGGKFLERESSLTRWHFEMMS